MKSLLLVFCFWVPVLAGAQDAASDGSDRLARLRELKTAKEHEAVIAESQRLLQVLDATDKEALAEVHCALAVANLLTNNENDATLHAQEALTFATAAADTATMVLATRILADVMYDGRRYDDALIMGRTSFRLALAHGDTIPLLRAHSMLANIFLLMGRPDSAEHYYREGLRRVPREEAFQRLVFESNLAKLLSERGAHEEAVAMLREGVDHLRSIEHSSLHKAVNTLAYALHNAGRHREAIAAFIEAEELNQASEQDISASLENIGFKAESQAALGDHKAAFESMLELEELLHTYYARTANEQLLELEKRFETKLKEEEIERLDAVTNEQAALLRARNLMLYGSLLMLVLALVAAALLWRNFRQKRRHAEVLEQFNNELKEQKERIEEINRLLQLKVLRTQMNPHFIYNCLNAIANLVRKGDAVGATSYLDGFARLLRMVLDHSVKDRVPISEELDFLRQYLKLEALRFPDGLHYEVDADRDLLDEDVPVPTLLVQPFVENAIWHGLANKEGEKRLSVRFEEHGESLRCVVEDNGVGRKAAPKRAHSDGSPSMGLQLTNERLQLLSFKLGGNSDRLRFHDLTQPDGTPAGTRVELVLE